ncbi:hypothetical protein VTK56DRAFT_8164 [Thermocarpiscus australiensis]
MSPKLVDSAMYELQGAGGEQTAAEITVVHVADKGLPPEPAPTSGGPPLPLRPTATSPSWAPAYLLHGTTYMYIDGKLHDPNAAVGNGNFRWRRRHYARQGFMRPTNNSDRRRAQRWVICGVISGKETTSRQRPSFKEKDGVLIISTAALSGLTIAAPTPETTDNNTVARKTNVAATSGRFTWYNPGLGACGIPNSDSDLVVALSHADFDPSTPNGNPNNNPLCGRHTCEQTTNSLPCRGSHQSYSFSYTSEIWRWRYSTATVNSPSASLNRPW